MREYQRRSGKIPTPLRDIPELTNINELYWFAFLDLYKRGNITYQEVLAYSKITGLDALELMISVHTLEDIYNDDSTQASSSS